MARTSLKGAHRLIRETEKNENEVPVELFFLQALQSSILKEQESKRLPSKTYKPSSMTCMRNMYYQRMGMGKGLLVSEKSYNLVGILETGTARHDYMQKHITKMKDNGIDCEYIDIETYIKDNNIPNLIVRGRNGMETKLYHTIYHLSFQTDGILRINGKYYVFEFKTETVNKFGTREEVDEKHYAQASAYALAFHINNVIFLYENRDTCELKSYLFEVSEGRINDTEALLLDVENHCIKGELPPKTPYKRNCYYCGYKDMCKRDYNVIEEEE